MSDSAAWRFEPGALYRDVLAKREDDRPVRRMADVQRGRLVDGVLTFDCTDCTLKALADGVFFLEIPPSFDPVACDRFAENFYKGTMVSPYGQYREVTATYFNDPLLGFHQRINQVQQFLLERRFWERDYPAEIARTGEALTRIGTQLLRSVLRLTDIPEIDWPAATGGCSDAKGSYHLTFNHYRPGCEGVGLSSHKDDGFLTILRVLSPGLEVNREDQWEALHPDPDCFVVNFGLSMEVLTRRCVRPIRAIMHRVRHQTADRTSFGHFTSSYCKPGAEEGIYQYVSGTGLHRVCGSRDLIDANDKEIYLGTSVPPERER